MKVFAIITEWFCRGESDATVQVYSTREKAQAEMENQYKEFLNNDSLAHNDDCVIDKNGNGFTAYEDGNYCDNHLVCSILEREVL